MFGRRCCARLCRCEGRPRIFRRHFDSYRPDTGIRRGGREAFWSSRLVQEAVIRNLEVIGEAARHLSDDLRTKHPNVPWAQIIAFRNFVIHAYWNIRLERVWHIIEHDLMPLQNAVQGILNDLKNADD